MSIFWVRYHDSKFRESMVSVMSADARTMRKADLRKARRDAVTKARAKLRQSGVTRAVIIDCRCVG